MSRITRQQSLAMYIRIHLVGASGGLRLAELLAKDPWMDGALDHLPGELDDEAAFAKEWASGYSRLPEIWTAAVFGLTAAMRVALSALRPLRGQLRRTVSLEAMRSLVLAKKAMWELGLSLHEPGDQFHERLAEFDRQAVRQAEDLQRLHQRAAVETFNE
ncbi:hypothetical protein GOEFS_014_00370 [Gordonia effusa NBRC 100432]|uniref:Uncharacterized protein n=1 Tax=Gordonia effusa NBRC 100432 TaxID=1077974 RepID=H0QVE4_9ACTN|nr:hypothetical protein [Gordonia effusa]GAB16795.1 hypothetical protein GOEFS_014_00370 [Gordonia effusa NBRC 100432]